MLGLEEGWGEARGKGSLYLLATGVLVAEAAVALQEVPAILSRETQAAHTARQSTGMRDTDRTPDKDRDGDRHERDAGRPHSTRGHERERPIGDARQRPRPRPRRDRHVKTTPAALTSTIRDIDRTPEKDRDRDRDRDRHRDGTREEDTRG